MKRDATGQADFGKFELWIQALILMCLIIFAVETLPDLSPTQLFWINILEIFSMSIFTLEYLMRVKFSLNRPGYIFSFFGIIDLLAILPFFIGLAFGTSSLQALGMFRLFRVFKLVRYSKAMRRFHRAFHIAKEEMKLFFMTACILFYLAGAGIYYFEHQAQPEVFKSVFDGLWWAVTTLTTVGYGDKFPITGGGKLFTFIIMMIGLGIIAVPTGLVASALAKARSEEDKLRTDKQKRTSGPEANSKGKEKLQPEADCNSSDLGTEPP